MVLIQKNTLFSETSGPLVRKQIRLESFNSFWNFILCQRSLC